MRSPVSLFSLVWVGAVVLVAAVPAGGGERVLFIGNSFTIGARASVPEIFDRLAQAGGNGDPVTVMRAVGGQDYEFHAGDATTRAVIGSDEWTHVVLQNYSTEPTHLVSAGHGIEDHFTHGTELYRQVMGNHPRTQVILFETWARAAAHSLITGTSSAGGFASTAEMQSELRANYQALADSLNAAHPGNPVVRVAPVGDAWENAGGLLPAVDPGFADLHGSDDYHGNDNGYYLAAAVFYCVIYGKSPEGLAATPEVASLGLNLTEDAAALESAAWATFRASTAAPVTYRFDFGASAAPTAGWNNVDPTTTRLGQVVSSRGEGSTIAFDLAVPFAGANQGGTAQSTTHPASASGDSLYGHTEPYEGREQVFPAFELSGLAADRVYALRFFASRMGADDNRTTRYTVEGADRREAELDAADNVDAIAVIPGVRPDGDGRLRVSLGPGEANSSPHHFTHLGVLEIEEREFTPLEFVESPADVAVEAFRAAGFFASVRGTPPFEIRWLLDGEVVPGEAGFAFALDSVPPEADGSLIQVRVTDATGDSILSPPAMLRVVEDRTPPALVGVEPSGDGRSIVVVFTEPVVFDGTVPGAFFSVLSADAAIPVAGASAAEGDGTVVIELGAPVSGRFTVVVSPAVADAAGNLVSGPLEAAGTVPDPGLPIILVDFGSSGTPTGPAEDPGAAWNNVTQSVGGSSSGGLGNLVSSEGASTGIRLEMVARFNGANTNGTTQAGGFPASATRDSLFGNTETFSGLSNIFPRFRLAGLDRSLAYELTFYASRLGVSDNRETAYTVAGAESTTVLLDPANNIDGMVTLAGVRPDDGGVVEIALAPGPANSNANHFTYLGALRIEAVRPGPAEAVLLAPEIVDGRVVLHWAGEGVLDVADSPAGPWTEVTPAPSSPYSEPVAHGGARFYRLRPAQ